MEDVPDVLHLPPDPARPLICVDEQPVQFFEHVAAPLPTAEGSPAKQDYEYRRCGAGSAFMVLAPHEGWRTLFVAEGATRTSEDYAGCLRLIAEEWFPDAEGFRLIQDNLSTHSKGSLHKAFPAPQARAPARKFEFHFTPKHASWLNPAESELSVLTRQCLRRRIPNEETLRSESGAWAARRNESKATVTWQFTTEDARTKLISIYPEFK